MGFLSSSFQAPQAPPQQTALAQGNVNNGLGAQGLLAAQAGNNNAFAMQNALAGQLQAGANGQGPNPALDQLNQTTGQNVAAQAALQGSQRGIGQNAGLVARQVANQGQQIQQQAVGQAATLQAQQQQGYQQQLAALTGQQVNQQQNALSGFQQGAQSNNASLLGFNQNSNTINSQTAEKNAGIAGNLVGGVLNGAGALGAAAMAHGGEVSSNQEADDVVTPEHLAEYFCGGGMAYSDGTGPIVPGKAQVAGDSKRNDTVSAVLSPGEIVIPRSHAMDPNKAAQFAYQVAMQSQRGSK